MFYNVNHKQVANSYIYYEQPDIMCLQSSTLVNQMFITAVTFAVHLNFCIV